MKEQSMYRMTSPLQKPVRLALVCAAALGCGGMAAAAEGFVSLFNGRDLSGWKVPVGDNGHWKVVGGVIDIDARSEASGDKSLWSEKEFGDFVLRVEWRSGETPVGVRAGVTPKKLADKDIGEWNRFEITMVGDRLTVVLNGETVIEKALLPGVKARGPIALQHHGEWRDGKWVSPPALVQFRNIEIKELPARP